MRKSRRANIDAMLRHLASQHDPHDFPSTAYERQALIEAAGRHQLIEWRKDRRRYELTPIGLRRLRRGGGLGLPALAISAGVGAAIGAAALVMLWLPADRSASHALGPPAENVGALGPTSPPGSVTTPPVTAGSAGSPTPAEPATVAEPPVAMPPGTEPATSAAKEPAAKKSRHGTAKGVGHRSWTFGQRYRDERFAGSGRP